MSSIWSSQTTAVVLGPDSGHIGRANLGMSQPANPHVPRSKPRFSNDAVITLTDYRCQVCLFQQFPAKIDRRSYPRDQKFLLRLYSLVGRAYVPWGFAGSLVILIRHRPKPLRHNLPPVCLNSFRSLTLQHRQMVAIKAEPASATEPGVPDVGEEIGEDHVTVSIAL